MSALRIIPICLLALSCSSEPVQGPAIPPEPLTPQQEAIACLTGEECPFGQRCIGGFCAFDADAPEGTACTTDQDCPEGEACAASTSTCVPIADEPTPYPDPEVTCTDGDSRPCGNKVGECEYGIQHCVAGAWQETCTGGVGPVTEICNGLDDDCDGEADENGNGLCDDGSYCNGVEICQGTCLSGVPIDCSSLTDQCTTGTCVEVTRSCIPINRTNGTACEDGQYCTVGDSCQAGACTSGGPRECSAAGGSCRTGVCDETADACTGEPAAAGVACSDGEFCTVDDQCDGAGTCVGNARDCTGAGDICNTGV